ncbi:MAG: T9SS type A sorting domain-containing protein [Bacteroidales bacterium]
MKKLIQFLFILISLQSQAQFVGQSGVYYLGTANVPISIANYSNPKINGVVVRFKWNDIEPTPGNFNWAFVDGEISKAITYHKKVSLQPLDKPDWLGSIGAKQYNYIDKNTAHATYGQVLSEVIPWDSTYVSQYKIFIQNLAAKYANNPVVSYVNTIGGNFSRNLPDTVIINTTTLTKQSFWKAFNYNADSLGSLMNKMTDFYMSQFPTTPLWCSVDYVLFQPNATGQARNYLASIYCNYGIAKYPDRFGLFREDISACNPPQPISAGSQWFIMQQNICRTGAQMLWSVQDGPTRMNQCGMLPNTKSAVLDSAINKALKFGMRYLEIYGADISDATLSTSIQTANNKLIAKGTECNPQSAINSVSDLTAFSISPTFAVENIRITFSDNQEKQQIQIFNSLGFLVKELEVSSSDQISVSELSSGMYFIRLKDGLRQTLKFIKY